MNVWLKTAFALVAVWLLAAGTIHWLHASQPTAASVTDYLSHTDIAAQSGAARAKTIHRLEDQLNDLSLEDRQRLQRSGATRRFFQSLTSDEQSAFLDATLPADFKQMMEAFNKMEPAKRKEFVNGALERMKEHADDGPPPDADKRLGQQVINQGLKSFYTDANADTKLDLAPLIEQMQHNLQNAGPGGPPRE